MSQSVSLRSHALRRPRQPLSVLQLYLPRCISLCICHLSHRFIRQKRRIVRSRFLLMAAAQVCALARSVSTATRCARLIPAIFRYKSNKSHAAHFLPQESRRRLWWDRPSTCHSGNVKAVGIYGPRKYRSVLHWMSLFVLPLIVQS